MIRRRAPSATACGIVLATACLLAQTPARSLATITEFDDRVGFVEVTFTGDGDGHLKIRYTFQGFYVVHLPVLSSLVQRGMARPDLNLSDTTLIFPKTTSVRITGNVTHSTTFEGPNRTDCWLDEASVDYTGQSRAAGREAFDRAFLGAAPTRADLGASMHFAVDDKRPSGGAVVLKSLQIASGVPVPAPEIRAAGTFTDFDAPGAVERRSTSRPPLNYIVTLGARVIENRLELSAGKNNYLNLNVEDAGPMPMPADFSAAAPQFEGRYAGTTRPSLARCSYLRTDRQYTYEVRYGVSLKQTADATLEPVDPNEAAWLPDAREIRSYRIKLRTPDHAGVSRVRAIISNASSHAGIATNAGMHNLTAPDCPYCTRGVSTVTHAASGEMMGLAISRTYRGLNACALDTAPDVFFRASDNPGYTLLAPLTTDLKNPIAPMIESTAGPTSDELVFKVFVADHAAAAQISAEVEVGGQWLPVKAIGATADQSGAYLSAPLDADADGIADAWSAANGRRPASEDADAAPNAASPGDGLTVFEEYRGTYDLGLHRRLDPSSKDLFVTDYTGTHLRELDQAVAFYRTYKLAVHPVDATEFRNDVINWQPVAAHASDQYLIAIMMNPATPAQVGWREFATDWITFAGIASRVGPPRKGEDTVLLQYENKARPEFTELANTVAHEIGHLVGLPHHGDGDGFIDEHPDSSGVTHGDHYAAVRAGQHSGEESCIMRYHNADLLCRAATLVPYSTGQYDPWPQPVTAAYTICPTAAGTGINASGSGAGDATRGACLAKIRVKPVRP